MLQQFTVENFLSFRDREVFKLQPGKGSRNKEHKVEPVKRHWILKSAALFGPNAGGKSNFVEALEFGKRLVLSSTRYYVITKSMSMALVIMQKEFQKNG